MNLSTGRLCLREFAPQDWKEVLAYQSDPRYLRYYAWTGRTEADVHTFVQRFVNWQSKDPRLKYQLALVPLEGGRIAGNCGLRLSKAGALMGELGYEVAPRCWGQGYATEAAGAMIEFGFQQLGLHRIWAQTVAENIASRRVMEKLGMRCEGRLRESQCFKSRWWDTLLYGILADECQLAERVAGQRGTGGSSRGLGLACAVTPREARWCSRR